MRSGADAGQDLSLYTSHTKKPDLKLQGNDALIATTINLKGEFLGYRNELYRAQAQDIPTGSVCVPASVQDWHARGWTAFAGIDGAEKSATRPNLRNSSFTGLSFSIHHCQEKSDAGLSEKIFLRIDSWSTGTGGETTDLPVMELIFDAVQFANPGQALESLKIMARSISLSERVASKAVNGALFLINQINAGQVPDFERVLELHRLHPDLNRSIIRRDDRIRNAAQAEAANANSPGVTSGRADDESERGADALS